MPRALITILRLTLKELRSLRADPTLLALIVYVFSVAVYMVAESVTFDVVNAAVVVVDEDRSSLSRGMRSAILPPHFKPAAESSVQAVDRALDRGRYAFALTIPPRFEADLLAGRSPALQILVDATAMAQAGNGAAYLESIVEAEVANFLAEHGAVAADPPITVAVRALFNPNLESAWFNSVMEVINNITMLAVILTGAALIREREHGTLEHLLAMPVTPADILLAKIAANGLVILVAALLSLRVVVQGMIGAPLTGSMLLFTAGAALYLFSITALGALLATFTQSMPQFALFVIPILIVMTLLSGSTTPMDSMPVWLQAAMQALPAPHFVRFAQALLYRGGGIEIVWPDMLALSGLGAAYVALSLARFRKMLSALQT